MVKCMKFQKHELNTQYQTIQSPLNAWIDSREEKEERNEEKIGEKYMRS